MDRSSQSSQRLASRTPRMLGLASLLASSAIAHPATAQITPDGSLGTLVNGLPTGCQATAICNITGGTAAGPNLFHGFSEFSINGGSATFRDIPQDTEAIFSRVRDARSLINGELGIEAGSTADLFLMNPNGIVFGPNARLNLQGSFTATTATGLGFGTSGAFDMATTPAELGLLTVTPSAFLYGQTPQPIQVQAGAELVVPETLPGAVEPEELVLAGGDVSVDGGVLRAPGGLVALLGSSTAGEITVGDDLTLSEGADWANVSLSNATVDVVAGDGGDFLIYANDIAIAGSTVCAGLGASGSSCDSSPTSVSTASSQAGNILLNATGDVSVARTRIENNLNPGETGNSENIFEVVRSGQTEDFFGFIAVLADSIAIADSSVSTTSFGIGNAGAVILLANDSTSISNSAILSNIGAIPASPAVGDAGGISIQSPDLLIDQESRIESSVFGTTRTADDVGRVLLSGERIAIAGQSRVRTEVLGRGNAGFVEITADDSITIVEGSRVSSSLGFDTERLNELFFASGSAPVLANGNPGDVQIDAKNSIVIGSGSRVESNINPGAQGIGQGDDDIGSVLMTAPSIQILDGSRVATNSLEEPQTGLFARGNSGIVLIGTNNLDVRNNSQISTTAFGQGNAGGVIIFASEDIRLENEGKIFANGQERATSGGLIYIIADRVIAEDSSGLTTSNFTQFGAREVRDSRRDRLPDNAPGGATLVFARRIVLDQDSFISALSISGEGGGIGLLGTEYIALNKNSVVTTQSEDQAGAISGSGGDVFAISQFVSATPRRDSDIVATAVDGKGGVIDLFALQLFDIEPRPRSRESNDASADSRFGANGLVSVNALDIDPDRAPDDLPANRLPDLIAEGCRPNGRPIPKDKLYITNRSGLPPNPNDLLRGNLQLAELEGAPVVAETKTDTDIPAPAQPVVTAQGWVRDASGAVFFTSRPAEPVLTASQPGYSSCGGKS